MTDWLAWLLEELEEEKDQGEDLELSTHILPGSGTEETGEVTGEKSSRNGAVRCVVGTSANETAEKGAHPAEDREKARDEQSALGELPLAVRQLSEVRLAQAARQAGGDQPWQTGTPAGTGDVRTAEPGRKESWLPEGGGRLRAETLPADGGNWTAAVQRSGDLYTAVRRARTAVEQAQGLRQSGPVVLREPEPVRQSPTPLELDRIFQRDARRYDGGFTLF